MQHNWHCRSSQHGAAGPVDCRCAIHNIQQRGPISSAAANSGIMRTPQPWTLPDEPTSTAALAVMGVSESMLATQLRHGTLRRLRQGVYLAQAAWPGESVGQHLMLSRAEVAANPAAVLSHQSAALIWQLPTPGFGHWHELPPSITLPAGRGFRSSRGLADHHVAELSPAQLSRDPAGYSVTGVARTAVESLPPSRYPPDTFCSRVCQPPPFRVRSRLPKAPSSPIVCGRSTA
jgi:hypothetical protein